MTDFYEEMLRRQQEERLRANNQATPFTYSPGAPGPPQAQQIVGPPQITGIDQVQPSSSDTGPTQVESQGSGGTAPPALSNTFRSDQLQAQSRFAEQGRPDFPWRPTPELAGNIQRQREADAMLEGVARKAGPDDPQDPGLRLEPYREGKGHHVLAKSAFVGAQNYSERDALSMPNAILEAYKIDHEILNRAQRFLYGDLAREGQRLSWKDIEKIETQVLMSAGLPRKIARKAVREAIEAEQGRGVAHPTRIPWLIR